jgi:hypothetical protein
MMDFYITGMLNEGNHTNVPGPGLFAIGDGPVFLVSSGGPGEECSGIEVSTKGAGSVNKATYRCTARTI